MRGAIDLFPSVDLPFIKMVSYKGNVSAPLELRAYWIGNKLDVREKLDIRDKTIIVLRGETNAGWTDYAEKNCLKVNYSDSYASGFNMLIGKRADYYLLYKRPAEVALQKMNIESLHYSVLKQFKSHFFSGNSRLIQRNC